MRAPIAVSCLIAAAIFAACQHGEHGYDLDRQLSSGGLTALDAHVQIAMPEPESYRQRIDAASARHRIVHRNVLSKSSAAPLRAEAAKQLGELLADDEESVLALSIATNHENPVVKQAARRALVRIFDARPRGREEEGDRLEEFGEVARARAYQLGQGAIKVIQWLWDNVQIWPA